MIFFHYGPSKMYQNLKKSFLYPNIKKDIAEYVAKCIVCE